MSNRAQFSPLAYLTMKMAEIEEAAAGWRAERDKAIELLQEANAKIKELEGEKKPAKKDKK